MPQFNAHVRQGAYLPHWTKEGATYHVRFRLADSMPQHILKEWQEEKKELLLKREQKKGGLTKSEEERLRELSSEKVEHYLHQGYGACFLRQDLVAKIVANALRKNDGKQYRLIAWCIMPNHVHVILTPLTQELHRIVNTWKSASARKSNRFLKRAGAFWQTEYFDHLIRNEENFHHAIEYVWNNPTEAGLKEWKWRWKAEEY
ncbi:MAG TPA: transposase [Candidatus Peribacterales bacterium]|nr:transposase [Candidatus Peribacterales bacterium]